MRQGKVLYNNILAGILTETSEGDYIFQYDSNYCKEHPNDLITFTMPVRPEPYTENRLFAFFEGLIPEGWLLDIASKSWKLNPADRMGLLLACCQNCIGAVSIEPIEHPDEK